MDRRTFCKIVSGTAAASLTRKTWANGFSSAAIAPENFDYARFCALPESERIFAAVAGDRIVTKKLDGAAWKATAWGETPKLPGIPDSWDGVPMESPIPGLAGTGPYAPVWDSLLQYEAPEWYRDAKFGIWAHWSPQCVPERGDWYARNMYIEDQRQYQYQLEHYGPPSRFGYKDLCAQWTLLNWQPEELIDRYKKAGARFFISLANHHDGFDCWDSKHQPWNAMIMGPHRDVAGAWAKASRDRGLRFGATFHQARNWWWFQPSHGADKQGVLAGVPYDGELTQVQGQNQWWQGFDPQMLYGPKHPEDALPDPSYVKNFYDRTRDFIDQHDPDLIYFDNALFPLGWGGMNIAAYYYNLALAKRGRVDVVANVKNVPDKIAKAVVADYERGLTSEIMPYAWQSETCIGQWHYNRALYDKAGEFGGYLHPRDVVHWLVDTVSKNGTFVLNVPGRPDGTIDSKEIAVLDRITAWMGVNAEAIYETRPWKVFGEGPTKISAGSFHGESVSSLGAKDVRFTQAKNSSVTYAIVLGLPREEMTIEVFGLAGANSPGRIAKIEVLGSHEAPAWNQAEKGLTIKVPAEVSGIPEYGVALKVYLA
jgi:alpha-L-fucosidase